MTNAEFLNNNFGTNYKKWFKCSWKYNKDILVWMVNFNKTTNCGWQNVIVDSNTIYESFVCDLNEQLDSHKYVFENYRLAVDKSQNYKILGLYKYDFENSNLHTKRIWHKVAESINEFISKQKHFNLL